MSSDNKKPTPIFVIDPAPTIKWPVTISIPVDGGEVASFQFTGVFKRLSDQALDEILGVKESPKIEPDDSGELATGLVTSPRMQDVLRENAELFPKLLVGWESVKTAAGEDVPFSIDALQSQVTGANGKFLSAGLWQAVAEIRHGARLGN